LTSSSKSFQRLTYCGEEIFCAADYPESSGGYKKNWNRNPAVTTAGPRFCDCDSEKKIKIPIF
jgi:hypothetical protein